MTLLDVLRHDTVTMVKENLDFTGETCDVGSAIADDVSFFIRVTFDIHRMFTKQCWDDYRRCIDSFYKEAERA